MHRRSFFVSRSSIPRRKHAYSGAPVFSKVRECADATARWARPGQARRRRHRRPSRMASSGLEAVSGEMYRLPVAPPARQ